MSGIRKAVFDPARSLIRSVLELALCALCTTLVVPAAWAGFVSTNEVKLDAIFHQAAFDGTPIDVFFNPTVTIHRPDLLTISTEQQMNAVFGLGRDDPTIDIFFVDKINECGGDLSPKIIGCGQEPGNRIVVESQFAASNSGAPLIAHELGHNLGLDHFTAGANLMNPTLNGSTLLTPEQVARILAGAGGPSSLVHFDHEQRFILITPFAVVPEPQTVLFAFAGFVWVMQRRLGRRES
jgi:hypothetical protein